MSNLVGKYGAVMVEEAYILCEKNNYYNPNRNLISHICDLLSLDEDTNKEKTVEIHQIINKLVAFEIYWEKTWKIQL